MPNKRIIMRNFVLSAAVAGAFAVSTAFAQTPAPATPAAPAAPAEPASPLSFNVGVTSNYIFRGVSQTHGKAAVQGGIDYLHASGFYVGAWASSITWVKDFLGKGSVEVDVYGGYKNSFGNNGDWNYDLGFITYNYPNKGGAIPTVLANPNTQELYGAVGYKWLTAKYSYATSSHFIGWYGGPALNQTTRGSSYLELNANYDAGNGWTLIGHLGHQNVKNSVTTFGGVNGASYTDWKLGVSKDIGFGTITAAYSDTNSTGSCSPVGGTNPYCWGNSGFIPGVGPTAGGKDVSKGVFVLSYLKTF
jgi:uncharacterized protein (TIGR02001 family)